MLRDQTVRIEALERRLVRGSVRIAELEQRAAALTQGVREESLRRILRGDGPGGGPGIEEPVETVECTNITFGGSPVLIPMADLLYEVTADDGPVSAPLIWNGNAASPLWETSCVEALFNLVLTNDSLSHTFDINCPSEVIPLRLLIRFLSTTYSGAGSGIAYSIDDYTADPFRLDLVGPPPDANQPGGWPDVTITYP